MRSRSLLLVLTLLLAACSGIGMDVPTPFLRLDTARSELKATTPDDARLWVREFDDRDRGGLAFWTATLRNDLVDNRGYELVAESELRDAAGNLGRLMHLRAEHGGERFEYLVAVFVREGWWRNTIRVAEFAARPAAFTALSDGVRAALATLR